MGINISINENFIALYAVATTLTIMNMVIVNTSKRRKYSHWKRTVLSVKLGVFGGSKEWERNNDDLVSELISENERLGMELSFFKREKTKFTIFLVKLLIMLKIWSVFTKNNKTKQN